jgi:ubiquinol-cytochrome c reductase iron-sulfur subunit
MLYATTTAVGAAGLVAAAWPFVDHLNPDAATRASGDVVDVDLAGLQPAQPRTVLWHSLPVVVVQRTAAMLGALQDKTLTGRLRDERSEKRQQPAYAANWHRSIDPAVSVLIGVCTYCGCKPQFYVEPFFADDVPGAYLCACCASHFDPAGRPYMGPAQYDLPVPPYEVTGRSRLAIGRNKSDATFTFESIERI